MSTWFHSAAFYPIIDPTTTVRFEPGEVTESDATDWVLSQPVLTPATDPKELEEVQAKASAESRKEADAQESERVAQEEALMAAAALEKAKAQEVEDAAIAEAAQAKAQADIEATARAEQIAKEKADAAK
jgi:hypothetical protein